MISPIEIRLVRASFNSVEKMAGIASLAFYQELFTLDPSTRRLFRGNIEEQGQKLIAALRFIVDTLETPQAIMPMLESLGRRHVVYGVREDDYKTVGLALIKMLRQVLGNQASAEVEQAWMKAYTHVSAIMIEAASDFPSELRDELMLDRDRGPE